MNTKLWLDAEAKFGVILFTDKVHKKLFADRKHFLSSKNNGIKFCIMPNKIWMFD
jgi:hypothetical protein